MLGFYGENGDTSGKLTQLLKMAIEIVDLAMKNGGFPQLCKRFPEGTWCIGEVYGTTWYHIRWDLIQKMAISLLSGTAQMALV